MAIYIIIIDEKARICGVFVQPIKCKTYVVGVTNQIGRNQ